MYDLESDPYEFKNLADDSKYSEKLNKLKQLLVDWQKTSGDPLISPEASKKLFVIIMSAGTKERIKINKFAIEVGANIIDLEWGTEAEIAMHKEDIPLLVSYHNFHSMLSEKELNKLSELNLEEYNETSLGNFLSNNFDKTENNENNNYSFFN